MATNNLRFVAKNGVDNNGNSITNVGVSGSSIALAGANALVLTTTGPTNITLPASGTLATTSGSVATATNATNMLGGSTNSFPYQTAANTTGFLAQGTGVLQEIAGAPAWTIVPTLTGTNFSAIPNGALINSSLTLGSTSLSLGSTTTTVAGLSSVTSTTFVGALTGNASTATTAGAASALGTARSISLTGDGAWTVSFDGSANVTSALTLSTVNASPVTASFSKFTTNGKGLVTASTPVVVGDITGLLSYTGDVTTSGTVATLATVNAAPVSNVFSKVTTNGKGLVTATSAVSASDITSALTYTPVNRAGDTMTGALNFGGFTAANAGAPSVGTDLTNKNYVDAAIAGLSWKTAVLVATTTNITLSGTQTIDGIAVVAGQRVLVKNQSTAANNGIYVVAAGAWARSTDSTSAAQLDGGAVYVQQGTTQADTAWTETATITTVGTDTITYVQFSGAGTYTAGTGISLTGNTFANTGVLSVTGSTNLITSASTGNITLSLPTTLSGLSSVTSSTFVGALTGNASTATSATNLVGGAWTVFYNGASANITVPLSIGASGTVLTSNGIAAAPTWSNVAAGTLTGTTLASGVVASSLTSVGTLSALAVTGTTNLAGVSSPLQVQGSAGTSGYVLTSAGAGVTPTWSVVSAPTSVANISGGAATQIPYQSAASTTAFSTGLTWTASTNTLGLGTASTSTTISSTAALLLTTAGAATATATTISSGASSANNGPAVNITAGAGSINGGHVNITSGNAGGGNFGGNVIITTGTSTTAANNGYLSVTTNTTERFRILAGGAWSVGSTGTAYGTAGQVLTSNGNAAPTWTAAPAATNISGGATNQIPYQSAASTTAFNVGLTFDGSNTLSVGQYTNGAPSVITTLANTGTALKIIASSGNGSIGGNMIVEGGSTSAVSNAGGNLFLNAGNATTSALSGYTSLGTYVSGTLTERLRILQSGAWSVGSTGTAYGTSGQVLTSTGATTAPTWQAVAASNITGGAANQIPFQTAPSTTSFDAGLTYTANQLTIGASGSNGVITTAIGSGLQILTPGGATPAALTLSAGNGTSSSGANVVITAGTGASGTINGGNVNISAGTAAGTGVAGTVNISGGTSSTGTPGTVIFNTAAAERMRIDSAGSIGVGVTPAALTGIGPLLHIKGSSTSSAGYLNSSSSDNGSNVGLYSGLSAADNAAIVFQTGLRFGTTVGLGVGSFVERMRIDSAGNLGINTTAVISSVKLNVAGGVSSNGLNVAGNGGFYNAANKFGVDNNAGQTRMYSSGANSTTRGSYDFRVTDSVGTLDMSAMQISSTGVAIGTASASPAGVLYLRGATATRPTIAYENNGTNYWNVALKGDAGQNYYMISNSAETVGVYMTTIASGWNNLSDERFKTNLTPITDAVAKVDALRAVTYKWLADSTLPEDVGLIAQDVLAVLPQAVDQSDPDKLGLRYTAIIPLLVAAVKELSATNAALLARITALEAKP